MSYDRQRSALSVLWFLMCGVMFLLMFIYDIKNTPYGDQTKEVWSWMLPNIVPTLTLMVSVFVLEAKGQGGEVARPGALLFRLAFALSLFYLAALLVLVVYGNFADDPLRKLQASGVYLGPFQGLVTAALGAFFIKKG
jgi:hypothetical protein